jgi:D-proline reductase (dithiol) PrdB
MAIDYITRLQANFSAQGFPEYQWSAFEDAPFAPPKKPLSECRIGVISSAGVHLPDQEPFNPVRDDFTFREVPRSMTQDQVQIHHNNYDKTDAYRDINCVIPFSALAALEAEGYVKEVADPVITFMGRVFRRSALTKEMAPWVHQRLQDMEVDAAFLIPV